MAAVDEATGRVVGARLRPYGEVKRGYTAVGEGDVLFAKITPCMQNGKHVVARDLALGIAFASTEFHVIRPGPEVRAEWVHQYLRQPDVLRRAVEQFVGTAGQQRVPPEFLRDLVIPLPPISVQRDVLSQLTQHLTVIERSRAAAEAQLDAARTLAAAHLRAVFADVERMQWPLQPLGTVADLLAAYSIAGDGDTDIRAVTTACLTEVGFDASGVKRARMRARDAAESSISPGEVLIARSNTPDLVGRAAMYAGVPSGLVASDLTIRVLPREGLLPEFLTGYLSFLYVSGYWRERAGGASGSMKKITRQQIAGERVPVPPIDEQHRLVATLRETMACVAQARAAAQAQLADVDALPAALLRRAFSRGL